MIDPLTTFGCVFLLGGVILDIISVATREWITFRDGTTSGLWAACTPDGECVPKNNTAKLDGVRAMMVLSILVSGIALVVIAVHIAHVCRKKVLKKWIVILVAFLAFFAVLLALIGILVYHRQIWSETRQQVVSIRHGYSFWFGVAAIIVFFVAGIFFLMTALMLYRSRRNEQKTDTPETDPVTYYDSKAKTPIKDVHWSNNLYGGPDRYPGGFRLYPFKDDFVYCGTSRLPQGIYSYEDPRGINPWLRDSYSIPDYPIPCAASSRPPIVWVA